MSRKPRLGRKLLGAVVDPLSGIPQAGGFWPISKLEELVDKESVAPELDGREIIQVLKKEKMEPREMAKREQKNMPRRSFD